MAGFMACAFPLLLILAMCVSEQSPSHQTQKPVENLLWADAHAQQTVRKTGGGGSAGKGSSGGKSSGGVSGGVSAKPSSGKTSSGSFAGVTSGPGIKTGYATSPRPISSKSGTAPGVGKMTGPLRPINAPAFLGSSPSWSASPSRTSLWPYYFVGGAGVGAVASASRYRCGQSSYQFGNGCRACSAQACPVGQYRTECDSQNDAYCGACTNKPNGTYYTTPGNSESGCLYETCPTDDTQEMDDMQCAGCDLTDAQAEKCYPLDDPVVITFWIEAPISQSEMDGLKSRYTAAIANLASVPPTSVNIVQTKQLELSSEDVVAGVTRRRVEESSVADSQTAIRRVSVRKLLQVNTTANLVTTTAAASVGTSPAPNTLLGTTPPPQSCNVTPPVQNFYTEAVIDVTTTERTVNSIWNAVNELDLNIELSRSCTPPTSLKYFSGASRGLSRGVSWWGVVVLSVAVSVWRLVR